MIDSFILIQSNSYKELLLIFFELINNIADYILLIGCESNP